MLYYLFLLAAPAPPDGVRSFGNLSEVGGVLYFHSMKFLRLSLLNALIVR